jgi:hypothetical protein
MHVKVYINKMWVYFILYNYIIIYSLCHKMWHKEITITLDLCLREYINNVCPKRGNPKLPLWADQNSVQ